MADIARRLGWERQRVVADSHRVRRTLGLRPFNYGYQTKMDYETALRITEAAGLDPVDVGL
jgi:hypothetical protein